MCWQRAGNVMSAQEASIQRLHYNQSMCMWSTPHCGTPAVAESNAKPDRSSRKNGIFQTPPPLRFFLLQKLRQIAYSTEHIEQHILELKGHGHQFFDVVVTPFTTFTTSLLSLRGRYRYL